MKTYHGLGTQQESCRKKKITGVLFPTTLRVNDPPSFIKNISHEICPIYRSTCRLTNNGKAKKKRKEKCCHGIISYIAVCDYRPGNLHLAQRVRKDTRVRAGCRRVEPMGGKNGSVLNATLDRLRFSALYWVPSPGNRYIPAGSKTK